MAKSKGGRPTKFNAEIADDIVKFLAGGGYIETAAAACGIHKDTLYAWLKQGARAESGPKRRFSDAVQKALAEAEIRASAQIQLHGKKEWQAYAWYLERRYPDRWGRRRLEVTGPDGGAVQHQHRVQIYLPSNGRD